MTTENDDQLTFNAEYVKELRSENASWRHKVRELEQKMLYNEVAVEFAKRGIDADPSIINIPEGMTAAEVVNKFAGILKPAEPQQPQQSERPAYPSALRPNSTNPNASSPPAQGAFGGRTLKEIEADPKAREIVRARYRELLTDNSYSSSNTIFDS